MSKTYKPTLEDFFPSIPRGTRRGEKTTETKKTNIEQWKEERGFHKDTPLSDCHGTHK